MGESFRKNERYEQKLMHAAFQFDEEQHTFHKLYISFLLRFDFRMEFFAYSLYSVWKLIYFDYLYVELTLQ